MIRETCADLEWFGGVEVGAVDTASGLAGQAGRIVIGDVIVLRVEEVEARVMRLR